MKFHFKIFLWIVILINFVMISLGVVFSMIFWLVCLFAVEFIECLKFTALTKLGKILMIIFPSNVSWIFFSQPLTRALLAHLFRDSSLMWGFTGCPGGKESACQFRIHKRCWLFDPGSGRSPGEGHANPLQDSPWENPMDRGTWRARPQNYKVGHDWSNLAHTHTCASCMCVSLCKVVPQIPWDSILFSPMFYVELFLLLCLQMNWSVLQSLICHSSQSVYFFNIDIECAVLGVLKKKLT